MVPAKAHGLTVILRIFTQRETRERCRVMNLGLIEEVTIAATTTPTSDNDVVIGESRCYPKTFWGAAVKRCDHFMHTILFFLIEL